MSVPFLDLQSHHASRRQEFLDAIAQVIDAGSFTGGEFVERFETEFAAYCQNDHAVGVGSGTDALWLALLAMDVGEGDEVITIPNTFIATAEAIARTGATPVFVDIDEATYNMDPEAMERAITPRTKVIIPVHLFGQPSDMDAIASVARKHGLRIIEDAAQAHGADYRGRRVGSLADASCFSFYPGKNLGAFGEAGAVVTGDSDLRDRLRILRNHGQERKYHHQVIGWNCRLDSIQAAILSVKLPGLDRANAARRARAADYRELLAKRNDLVLPAEAADVTHVYHVFAIRILERDDTMVRLMQRGIQCGIHYPVPVHLQPAFRSLGYEAGSLPVAERVCESLLSLPICPEMSAAQVATVARALAERGEATLVR